MTHTQFLHKKEGAKSSVELVLVMLLVPLQIIIPAASVHSDNMILCRARLGVSYTAEYKLMATML